MKSHGFLLALALIALTGCGTMAKENKANAMDAALGGYGEAIRWGYFDTAYSYLHPDQRRSTPGHLENIRVTGYEVVQPPILKDDQNAEQLVRIEYVHENRQVVRSLSDRQLWRFDQEGNAWWLVSGVPRFD